MSRFQRFRVMWACHPVRAPGSLPSFAVANAISVPLTGWLAQRFGQVKVFVVSILLFVLASWLCGLSHSLEMLVAFRVLQGLVAGPMIPLSQTLLLQSYPPAKAGIALAAWSMTTLTAPVMGPILGGWISDNLSWPWIFYINIPAGMISAWVTWQDPASSRAADPAIARGQDWRVPAGGLGGRLPDHAG